MIHPNFEFCEDWMAYLEDCIIPNQPATYGQPGYTSYEDVIEQWAQFQEFEPELFNSVVSNLEDCSPAGNLDDYIFEYYYGLECLGALAAFEAAYDLTFDKTERKAIWAAYEEAENSPNCGDQEAFNLFVLDAIIGIAQENQNVIVNPDDEENIEVDNSGVLPYDCSSFDAILEVIQNEYTITIKNWKIEFLEIGIPLRRYSFEIDFNIYVRALPGEEKCQIQNLLATALNNAVQATTFEVGRSRLYRTSNAQSTIEESFQSYFSANLSSAFPLDSEVNVPPLDPPNVGVNLIPGVPGETENCCD